MEFIFLNHIPDGDYENHCDVSVCNREKKKAIFPHPKKLLRNASKV